MDPGNQLNSREGCQENLTFLSKRQEVVTHLKAGGVRPGWGAGGESSLGLTKLKERNVQTARYLELMEAASPKPSAQATFLGP